MFQSVLPSQFVENTPARNVVQKSLLQRDNESNPIKTLQRVTSQRKFGQDLTNRRPPPSSRFPNRFKNNESDENNETNMLKKSSFYPSVGFSATSSRKTELENQLNFGNNEMKLEKPEEQIVEPEYCPHVSPWTPTIDLQTKLELDYGFETISSYKTYIPSNLTSTSQNLMDHFDDKFYLENESDLDISSDDDLEYLVQSHCKMPFSDFSLTNNENAMEFPEAFNIIVDILDD